jgi:uncharacterized protein YaeQ
VGERRLTESCPRQSVIEGVSYNSTKSVIWGECRRDSVVSDRNTGVRFLTLEITEEMQVYTNFPPGFS